MNEAPPPDSGSLAREPVPARREFARRIDSLEAVFAFMRPLLDAHGVIDADAYAIEMTVEELFTNMVKYNAAGSGQIELEMGFETGAVRCRLTDSDSDRFGITQAPDVDIHQPVEQRRPGGLGIHLVRRMVEAIEY